MDTPFEINPLYNVTPKQLEQIPHLIQPESKHSVLDPDAFFGRSAPLEIDVGSGKGRFVAARAAAFPEHNFLAIEKQLGRVRCVQSKIRTNALENLRLLRVEASHVIMQMLPDACIHTCYVFFPDPWPKRRHSRRRLFNDAFRAALWEKLSPGGRLNFASDQLPYFEQVFAGLEADSRFEQVDAFVTAEHERSEFEQLFLSAGDTIGRCSFVKA